jgi:methyl coenzyme M reductase subunit C-like uncharacterized protein (methanogenesis marker protein 7)
MADDCARFGAKARKRCGPAGGCARKLKKISSVEQKIADHWNIAVFVLSVSA